MTDSNHRHSDYPVNPIFLDRWSPRAFLPGIMPKQDLMTILEAGRFAPSAANGQPWRFIHVSRESADWETAVSLLEPFNAVWARQASVLMFVLSRTRRISSGTGEVTPIRSHAFDAGSATLSMALQAAMLGYQAHPMGGVVFDRVMAHYNVPDTFRVEVAVAIGKVGPKESLPEQFIPREHPSERLPLEAIAFENSFRGE